MQKMRLKVIISDLSHQKISSVKALFCSFVFVTTSRTYQKQFVFVMGAFTDYRIDSARIRFKYFCLIRACACVMHIHVGNIFSI